MAGLRMDLEHQGWVRLYPLNYRHLDSGESFQKYEVVTLQAKPARQDARLESWRPNWESIRRVDSLPPWKPRRRWLDEHVEDSMCRLFQNARADPRSKSLALVHPRAVTGFDIEPHPGWTDEEQGRLDDYRNNVPLGGSPEAVPMLEAPRFKAWYRWRCWEASCAGHRQGLLDWEFVALQRRLKTDDDQTAMTKLRQQFVTKMCAANKDTAFYVGNQAKHPHVFSVLGVYYPSKTS